MLQELAELPEVQDFVGNALRKVAELLEPLRPVVAAVGKAMAVAAQIMAMLPAELRESVRALADRGWFYDPHMYLQRVWLAKNLIESGRADEAEAIMAEHFEDRLADIEAKLVAALPKRASKFKSAFAAHRRGEYDLSILAFIAQADGVSAELRGGYFFLTDRKTREQETAAYARGFDHNPIDRMAHLALIETLAIREKISSWSAGGSQALNRHAVMHGASLDYDTKENSLRALSLLNYVALSLQLDEGSALAAVGTTALGTLVQAGDMSMRHGRPPTGGVE